MAGKRSADQRDDVDFRVLRLIEERPEASQREIANELGVSLGAANYCIRALIEKGHIKVDNFRRSKNKIGYIYVLTPEGISHRAHMAAKFIERKIEEYNSLKREIEKIKRDFDI